MGEPEDTVGASSASAEEESGTETETEAEIETEIETAKTTVSESDLVGESEETTVEAVLSEPEKVEADVKDKLFGDTHHKFILVGKDNDDAGTTKKFTVDDTIENYGVWGNGWNNSGLVTGGEKHGKRGFYTIAQGDSLNEDEIVSSWDETHAIDPDPNAKYNSYIQDKFDAWLADKSYDIAFGYLFGEEPASFMYWKIDGDDANKTIHYYASAGDGRTAVTIGTDGIEYTGLETSEKEKIKKAVIEEPIVATDVRRLFYYFKGLVSITNLGNLDTSNATSFKAMFEHCEAIEKIETSGLETDSLTDTSYMFTYCTNATDIILDDNFDTSNVTSMREMFNTTGAEELDLTKFDTSNVTDMYGMFATCQSLKAIRVSDKFVVDQVTSSRYMFSNCDNLEGEKGTTYGDTTGNRDKVYAHIDEGSSNPGLFSGASGSAWYWYLDGSTIHYTTTGGDGRTKITYSEPSGGKPAMVKYDGLTDEDRRQNITKAAFDDTIQVENLAGLFYDFRVLKNIENLENLDTSTTTTMEYMFAYCYKLEYVDLTKFDTSNVTTMSYMFYQCSALEQLNLIKFDTKNVTQTDRMFDGCTHLETIIASDKFVVDQVTNSDGMFGSCDEVVGGHGAKLGFVDVDKTYANIGVPRKNILDPEIEGFFTADPTPIPGMYWYLDETDPDNVVMHFTNVATGHTQVYYLAWDYYYYDHLMRDIRENKIKKVVFDNSVKALETIHSMFLDFKSLTSITDLKSLDTSEVKQMYRMFENCESIEAIDFQSLNTSKLQGIIYLFRNCKSLKSMDFSKCNTSELRTMIDVFRFCEKLTDVTFGNNFDTSNVRSFDTMFSSCTSLTTLDLTMFDTKNAQSAFGMFEYCTSLKTIKVSDKFDFTNVNGDGMFSNCTSLVGGNGTVYDSTKIDQEYARIDTASTPGYFTGGSAPTPEVEVSSIKILTNPTKTSYTVGDKLNPAGLRIEVTYSDGDIKEVSYNNETKDKFSFIPSLSANLNTAHKSIKITYGKKSTSFNITVSPKTNPQPYNPGGSGTGGSSSGGSNPENGPMGDLTKNPMYQQQLQNQQLNTTNNIPQTSLLTNTTLISTLQSYSQNQYMPKTNARDQYGNIGFGQWQQVPGTQTWYFLSGDLNSNGTTGTVGLLTNGWYNLGWDGQDKWYHFDANGVMGLGWYQEGGKTYYLETTPYDNWYGKAVTGQQIIDGKVYNFDESGALIS